MTHDAVVCGAGPAGSVIARRLAAAGVRVALVDAAVRPGATVRSGITVRSGAAVRTGAAVWPGMAAGPLADVRRALAPGGRLLVVDMMPHDRTEYRQSMGHLWQGFSAETLGGWMTEAGLGDFRYIALPPDPDAKGPVLFAATAARTA